MRQRYFSIIFYFVVGLIGLGLFVYSPQLPAMENESSLNYYARGDVIKVQESQDAGPSSSWLTAKIISGVDKGKQVEIGRDGISSVPDNLLFKEGDRAVLIKTKDASGVSAYHVAERYRLSALMMIGLICVIAIVYFGKRQGAKALVGLAFTIIVITKFIVPSILAGTGAFAVSIIGSLLILAVGLYLVHGLSRRTSIALLSTALTVVLALVAGEIFVRYAYLFGLGSEAAFYLQIAQLDTPLNLRGLLLGAIVIGTLGILDDVTTTQTAAIEELCRANLRLSYKELYRAGMSIGREHIASLVNTLALAYVGASFPLLLLFTFYREPLWVVLNSELIAEEIVRTLIGSLALIIAVPISTFFAALYFSKYERKI